ncbi:uncharacterized protein LOC127809250 [Diospyros lotus]|uniref:uncharacterized protein LOC127809250 n=1 Tax=Diospyros lotus TaxID=55363 RepID=UPI002255D943|nr:uncharacterized protein LOC127809250 [Diospyros lotus]
MKKGSSSSSSAYSFAKRIISVLSSVARAKSMAIRNKANALKARAFVLSLLKNRKFSLPSFSHKIQAILGHQHGAGSHGGGDEEEEEEYDESKAIVLHNAAASSSHSQLVHDQDAGGDDRDYQYYYYEDEEEEDKYPDLRHSLFEEEEEDELDLGGPNASVIDLVRNAREGGEEFKLEDEINHVADLFIMKFHKRMRLQKLESFKRLQEMLQRSL